MKLARTAVAATLSLLASHQVCCQSRLAASSNTTTSTAETPKPSVAVVTTSQPRPNVPSFAQSDIGVFSELAPRLEVHFPKWVESSPTVAIRAIAQNRCYLYVDGVAVGACPDERAPLFETNELSDPDPDHDGIPSSLDVLLGAKKTVLLGTPYRETYRTLAYPNGDVPRDEGVCSDVVVRALRNAGYDLQALIQEDRRLAPSAYPGIEEPDANIDHRRVRNLLVYFTRHFEALPVDGGGSALGYLPGDILLFDTMGDSRPEHIGIVSDTLGPSGRPYVINAWTNGFVTAEMDLLALVPVTHRFRVPTRLVAPSEYRGLEGLLTRERLALGPEHRQVLLVLAPTWGSSYARLYAFERGEEGSCHQVGVPAVTRLGSAGLARGRGVGMEATAPWSNLPEKVEGDHRSPAGRFLLGTAFGRQSPGTLPTTRWPYRRTTARDTWVDDPVSLEYNTWQTLPSPESPHAWSSAERLDMYGLALVIRHNDAPIRKGAGSAHFLHDSDLGRPTTGCTSIKKTDLSRLLSWLEPSRRPLLIQTAGFLFE
jgi:uncharacterized protein